MTHACVHGRALRSRKNDTFFQARGFTLIEILLVVAIFAVLLLVGIPLSSQWVKNANLVDAEAQLTQAVGRAKATALRNQMAATGNSPVAAVCLNNSNVLSMLEGVYGTPPNCTSTPPSGNTTWQVQLKQGVTIKNAGGAFSCVCFSNKGFLTNTGNCSACSSTTDFTLEAGSETVNITLH